MLYIPKKIIVGFQNRSDTFDGKLAFITYYDNNGEIANENRWKKWCDNKIETVEFDNIQFKNAILNKKVSHPGYKFGTGKTTIRIYDSRGFEYEIDIDNFMGLAEDYSVVKGEILCDLIYAFENGKVILLPVESEQYKEAEKSTVNLNTKLEVNDLTVGGVYLSKTNELLCYVGVYNLNKDIKKYINIPINKQKAGNIFYNYKSNKYEMLDISKIGIKKDQLTKEAFEEIFNNYVGTKKEKIIDSIIVKKDFDVEEMLKLDKNSLLFGDKFFDKKENREIYHYQLLLTPRLYKKSSGMYNFGLNHLTMYFITKKNNKYGLLNDYMLAGSMGNNMCPALSHFYFDNEESLKKNTLTNTLVNVVDLNSFDEENFVKDFKRKWLEEWKRNGIGVLMYKFKDGTTELISKY